jgi:glycerate kinase
MDQLPVADGGEGSLSVLAVARGGTWHTATVPDAFGRPRQARWLVLPDGTAVVESAEAIPLDPSRLEPLAASSRGLGELIAVALAARPHALIVCLGGTATVDGGAGMLEVVGELGVPTTVACDVDSPLLDAARVFAPQKGAGPAEVAELERRLTARRLLSPHAERPGAGAAGGLGAAFAALGADLVPGAPFLLDALGFDAHGYALVVTGEGMVDATTGRGKAPGEVARLAALAGVPCVVFGGRVLEPLPGTETVALSGDPARARGDLVELGRRLAGRLAADLLGE